MHTIWWVLTQYSILVLTPLGLSTYVFTMSTCTRSFNLAPSHILIICHCAWLEMSLFFHSNILLNQALPFGGINLYYCLSGSPLHALIVCCNMFNISVGCFWLSPRNWADPSVKETQLLDSFVMWIEGSLNRHSVARVNGMQTGDTSLCSLLMGLTAGAQLWIYCFHLMMGCCWATHFYDLVTLTVSQLR